MQSATMTINHKIQSAASKLEYTSRNLMIVDFCELTDSEWIVVALVLF